MGRVQRPFPPCIFEKLMPGLTLDAIRSNRPALQHSTWQTLLASGSLSAIGAYTMFALSAPLTKWLIVAGDGNSQAGGDAISFCNLLFLGNAAAAILILLMAGHRQVLAGIKQLNRWGVVSMVATSLLAIATPAAFFFALRSTSVANVILLSRAGPVFFAIGGTLLLGRQMTRHQIIGYSFIGLAILIALVVGSDAMFNVGDLLALAAAMGAALISLVGCPALEQMELRAFVFARNVLSAAGFAAIALYLFGLPHFGDLVMPEVVGGILVYGALVVGAGQLLWFKAVQTASPRVVGGWSFISPLTGIVLTGLLLHEQPHPAQWIALGLVVIGMTIAAQKEHAPSDSPAVARSTETQFTEAPPAEARLAAV